MRTLTEVSVWFSVCLDGDDEDTEVSVWCVWSRFWCSCTPACWCKGWSIGSSSLVHMHCKATTLVYCYSGAVWVSSPSLALLVVQCSEAGPMQLAGIWCSVYAFGAQPLFGDAVFGAAAQRQRVRIKAQRLGVGRGRSSGRWANMRIVWIILSHTLAIFIYGTRLSPCIIYCRGNWSRLYANCLQAHLNLHSRGTCPCQKNLFWLPGSSRPLLQVGSIGYGEDLEKAHEHSNQSEKKLLLPGLYSKCIINST